MHISLDRCSVYFIHYSKLVDRLPQLKANFSLFCEGGFESSLVHERLISRERVIDCIARAECDQKSLVGTQLPLILYPVLLNVEKNLAEEITLLPKFPAVEWILDKYKFIHMNTPSAATIEHCFQHYYAMARFMLDDSDVCLILEDDAIFVQEFLQIHKVLLYAKSLSAQSSGGCFFDLSNGCNLTAHFDEKASSSSLIYFDRLLAKRTRTTVAYLIDKKAASVFLAKVASLYMAIDWHLTYCMQLSNVDCFWIREPLFVEGSSTGYFASNALGRIKGY